MGGRLELLGQTLRVAPRIDGLRDRTAELPSASMCPRSSGRDSFLARIRAGGT